MPQQRISSTARILSSTDTDRKPRQTGCPQLVASYDTQEYMLGLFYFPGPTGGLSCLRVYMSLDVSPSNLVNFVNFRPATNLPLTSNIHMTTGTGVTAHGSMSNFEKLKKWGSHTRGPGGCMPNFQSMNLCHGGFLMPHPSSSVLPHQRNIHV